MNYKQQAHKYLAKVAEATQLLESLAPIIRQEVEQRFGRRIKAAKDDQQRRNLRHYYTVQMGRENLWKQTYLSDRDLYIRLTTMYGILALVEESEEGWHHPDE